MRKSHAELVAETMALLYPPKLQDAGLKERRRRFHEEQARELMMKIAAAKKEYGLA